MIMLEQTDLDGLRDIIREQVREAVTEVLATAADGTCEKDILTLTELEEYTGISRSTLYKMVSARTIPHYKRGRTSYFRLDEIRAWLTEYRVATQDEIAERARANLRRLDAMPSRHTARRHTAGKEARP